MYSRITVGHFGQKRLLNALNVMGIIESFTSPTIFLCNTTFTSSSNLFLKWLSIIIAKNHQQLSDKGRACPHQQKWPYRLKMKAAYYGPYFFLLVGGGL